MGSVIAEGMNPWAIQKGFTIVELLIVIVVIGILAAITFMAYNGVQDRAGDSRLDSDAAHIKTAIEMYKADNGVYPSVCAADNTGCAISSLSPVLVPKYIATLPSTPGLYQYVRGAVTNDSYGIMINYKAKPSCKTGRNVAAGWWGSSVPIC